jgi:hypothetical protein
MLIGISLSLLFLLLLLVVLLWIPLSLNFNFVSHRTSGNEIVLRWFFGLVKIRIPLEQGETPVPKKKLNKPKQQEVDNKEVENRGKSAFKLLLQKRFRHRLFDYMSDFWHSISKQDIKVDIKAGLGDPADTGQLWAIVGPTSVALANIRHLSVNVEPDFINAGFQLDGSGTIRFIPLRIIFISLKLFFSPVFWKGLRHIRAGNKTC